MRYCFCLVALCLVVPVRAQTSKTDDKKAPLHEVWQAAYLEGLKIGHGHILSIKTTRAGKDVIRTTRTLDFVLKRYGSVLPIRQEQICEEDSDGNVLYLEETLTVAKDKRGPLKGTVSGKKMTLSVAGQPRTVTLDFPEGVTGSYHQEHIFAKKKLRSGDKFDLTSFEIMLLQPVKLSLVVKDSETTDRLVLNRNKVTRESIKATRVEVLPARVKIEGKEIELPAKTTWLDSRSMPIREQFQMPGVGTITLYSTSKEIAQKEGVAPELLPDLGLNVSITLNKTIDNPYDTKEVVYRVTTTETLEGIFTVDERQKVRNEKGKSFDLVVTSVRSPSKSDKAKKPDAEYLESNQFIESDDKSVQALTKKAIAAEKDDWKKAQKIERWVHDNMKVSTSTGFPTAAQIAKDLEGDCRQHALLTAAMCRAAGIPSRTAIGLVYVREEGRSPILGFHMWAEVWIQGQWLGLDAIVGKGSIGASHLKMGDHSWAKTVTLAPLLPVSRVLGKMKVEVVSAK